MAEEEDNENEEMFEEDDDVEFLGEGEEFMIDEDDAEGMEDGEDGEEMEEEEYIQDDSEYQFHEHNNEPVYCVAVAHKGDGLLSGGGDDQCMLWSSNAKVEECTSLGVFEDSVVAAAFSANDEWVAVGVMDGTVKAFHLPTKREVVLEGCSGEIEWLSWHPEHAVLLAGSQDTTVWLWNLAVKDSSNALLGVFTGHQDSVTCGAFTPNGRRIITASMDSTLKLWDPNSPGACVHTFSGSHMFHEGGIVSMAIQQQAGNGGLLIATGGGSDGMVCVIKLDVKKVIAKFVHTDADAEEPASVESLAFAEQNASSAFHVLCSGGSDGRVVVWDLTVQAKRSVLLHPAHNPVIRMIFLPNSNGALITACTDGVVRRWNVRSSKMERQFTGHRDVVLDMALLPDGKRVVTGSEDGTCRIFMVAAQE